MQAITPATPGDDLAARPRYARIAEELTADITAGRRGIGTLLPTEHALCAQHGVSRATVREALRQLQDQGLIARSQGVGSRVLASSAHTNYVLSARHAAEAMGYAAKTRLIIQRRRHVRANAALARMLGAEPGSAWLHLSGLRRLAGETRQPLAISSIYLAAAHADLADGPEHLATPFFILIERQKGIRIEEITQDVTAGALTASQARALHAPAGSGSLHVLRRFLAADGKPVEVTRNIHPADRFTFSLRLQQS